MWNPWKPQPPNVMLLGLALALIAAAIGSATVLARSAEPPAPANKYAQENDERCDLPGASFLIGEAEKRSIASGQSIEKLQTSAEGRCSLNVQIVREPRVQLDVRAKRACRIDVVPIDHSDGEAVQQTQSGDCSGIGVNITISGRPEHPSAGGVLAKLSHGSQWVDARILAVDLPSYQMLIASSQINWTYPGGVVSPINFPEYHGDPSPFWSLTSWQRGTGTIGDPAAVAYQWNSLTWHSNGFPFPWMPDVDAFLYPAAYGYGDGSWSCSYSHSYSSNPYNLAFWDICGHYP